MYVKAFYSGFTLYSDMAFIKMNGGISALVSESCSKIVTKKVTNHACFIRTELAGILEEKYRWPH